MGPACFYMTAYDGRLEQHHRILVKTGLSSVMVFPSRSKYSPCTKRREFSQLASVISVFLVDQMMEKRKLLRRLRPCNIPVFSLSALKP